jgi:hypothetical protein
MLEQWENMSDVSVISTVVYCSLLWVEISLNCFILISCLLCSLEICSKFLNLKNSVRGMLAVLV